MKIVGVNGSPRKGGNTEILLAQLLQEAQGCNAETCYIGVEQLDFGGCKGCLWCQQKGTGRCIQNDDMTPIYDIIAEADAVIFASPIYFSTMTGQMKIFMDRLYPFYGRGGVPSRLPKKTKAILIFTQGQPDTELYFKSIEIAASAFRLIGFDVLETFVAPDIPNKGDILKSLTALEQAKALGKKLCTG